MMHVMLHTSDKSEAVANSTVDTRGEETCWVEITSGHASKCTLFLPSLRHALAVADALNAAFENEPTEVEQGLIPIPAGYAEQ